MFMSIDYYPALSIGVEQAVIQESLSERRHCTPPFCALTPSDTHELASLSFNSQGSFPSAPGRNMLAAPNTSHKAVRKFLEIPKISGCRLPPSPKYAVNLHISISHSSTFSLISAL